MWINKKWKNKVEHLLGIFYDPDSKGKIVELEEKVSSLSSHIIELETWRDKEIGKQPDHEHVSVPDYNYIMGTYKVPSGKTYCRYCRKPMHWCVEKEKE